MFQGRDLQSRDKLSQQTIVGNYKTRDELCSPSFRAKIRAVMNLFCKLKLKLPKRRLGRAPNQAGHSNEIIPRAAGARALAVVLGILTARLQLSAMSPERPISVARSCRDLGSPLAEP